jgi:hypothetical protein
VLRIKHVEWLCHFLTYVKKVKNLSATLVYLKSDAAGTGKDA